MYQMVQHLEGGRLTPMSPDRARKVPTISPSRRGPTVATKSGRLTMTANPRSAPTDAGTGVDDYDAPEVAKPAAEIFSSFLRASQDRTSGVTPLGDAADQIVRYRQHAANSTRRDFVFGKSSQIGGCLHR